MKRFFKLVIAALTIVVLMTSVGCANKNNVAKVNGKVLTKEQFEQRKKIMWILYGIKVEGAEQENQVLEEMVDEAILVQAAEKENIQPDETRKTEFFNDVKEYLTTQRFQSEEELNNALQAENLTMASLEETLAKQVRIETLYQSKIANVTLAEEDKPYYDEQIHARHILVDTEQEAKQLLEKIKAGEDFAALAKSNSKDTGSAENGGDLGFFGRVMMVEPFEEAAFALQPGQVSEPVKTDFGYHLIKVEERKAGGADEAALLETKKQDVLRKFYNEQVKNAKVEVYLNPAQK